MFVCYCSNMTNNTHRVIIDLTYADDDAYASVHTANYASQLRNALALGDKATATVKVENDINADRIVRFTPSEVTELADFLRTFEASPKALELLQRVSMRSIYAIADAEDGEQDDEPRAPGFDDIKSQHVMTMTARPEPLPSDEQEVLLYVADIQRATFDGFVKVRERMYEAATTLESRGLLVRKNTQLFNHIYRTSTRGAHVITALEASK